MAAPLWDDVDGLTWESDDIPWDGERKTLSTAAGAVLYGPLIERSLAAAAAALLMRRETRAVVVTAAVRKDNITRTVQLDSLKQITLNAVVGGSSVLQKRFDSVAGVDSVLIFNETTTVLAGSLLEKLIERSAQVSARLLKLERCSVLADAYITRTGWFDSPEAVPQWERGSSHSSIWTPDPGVENNWN